MSPLLQQEVKLENMRYRSGTQEVCVVCECVFALDLPHLFCPLSERWTKDSVHAPVETRGLLILSDCLARLYGAVNDTRTQAHARKEVQRKSLTSDIKWALFRSDKKNSFLQLRSQFFYWFLKFPCWNYSCRWENNPAGNLKKGNCGNNYRRDGVRKSAPLLNAASVCVYFLLCFSVVSPHKVFHDCWPLLSASFHLIGPQNEEKTTIVILMSLCTRDKIPSSDFTVLEKCNTCAWIPSQFVSKYLRTLWSEDCLSFWLSLNLNLCRHTVGKSESLLIPLPRASVDPFSWHFCMSALSTGGFCMAVYEYLLMLRLTWLTVHVCSHDNVLSWPFVSSNIQTWGTSC